MPMCISFHTNQVTIQSACKSYIFGTFARFKCGRLSLSFISPFSLFIVISSFQSLWNMYPPLPNFSSVPLCVSIRQALILGGLREAPSFLSNSFIRSPAVSCQGLSLLLVSEGRTGRVQHVGTRSQLLHWCCRRPWSFETCGKMWPYHSSCFCLFICLSLKGVMCKIKKMWRKTIKHGSSMEENVSVLLFKLFRSR